MNFAERLFSSFEDKREILDLQAFNDKLALEISWTPVVKRGAIFCAQSARTEKDTNGTTITFRTAFGVYLYCLSFVAVALFFPLIVLILVLSAGADLAEMAIFMPHFLFFLLFSGGVGLMLLCSFRRRECRFDKLEGKLSRGEVVYGLSGFCAIQLIRRYVGGSRLSYYSYEMNLIRRDGTRVNVVVHGNLRLIRKDADLLGQYLEIPVWDVIAHRVSRPALSH